MALRNFVYILLLYVTYFISAKIRAAVSVGCQHETAAVIAIIFLFYLSILNRTANTNNTYLTDCEILCLRDFLYMYIFTDFFSLIL